MAAPAKYDLAVYPIQVAVRSASDGAAVHQVTLPYCDCADFTNRKGVTITVGDGRAVTICKHLAEALERVGGWHRQPEAEHRMYPSLSRQQAFTVLTSSYIAADLAERILKAARAANGLTVTHQLANGELRAEASPGSPIWYTLWIPASQPVASPSTGLPEHVRA